MVSVSPAAASTSGESPVPFAYDTVYVHLDRSVRFDVVPFSWSGCFERHTRKLAAHGAALVVWSAGGRWGDKPPEKWPLTEMLPHDRAEMAKGRPSRVTEFVEMRARRSPPV